ncbi:hypothetical protein SCE1572_12585 [Sorangium cellulosum So0157-2]|uniref:Uncharacterized protein n=1 Tax=Sorangium cellulosum So0157-2 TaxID=1254432 RepID=S4XPZ7_SORCE|nr:hypothetical protein SCE1572_12585 [Sorangium cellulosum So0157-2]
MEHAAVQLLGSASKKFPKSTLPLTRRATQRPRHQPIETIDVLDRAQ